MPREHGRNLLLVGIGYCWCTNKCILGNSPSYIMTLSKSVITVPLAQMRKLRHKEGSEVIVRLLSRK